MEEEKKEEVIEEVKEVNEVNEKVNEPVVVPTTVIEPEKKSKKKLIIILSIVGVVLIGIIVALILLLGGKKKYTVTFDTQGGNVIEKVEVEKGATVPRPATPVKEGYTFKGWEYAGTPYYFNIGISSDMTIKATWEEDTSHKEGDIIKVTFVYDNGDYLLTDIGIVGRTVFPLLLSAVILVCVLLERFVNLTHIETGDLYLRDHKIILTAINCYHFTVSRIVYSDTAG